MTALNRIQQLIKSVNSVVEYDLEHYQEPLNQIKAFHKNHISRISDEDLKNYSLGLMEAAKSGTDLNDLLVQAYALVKEACTRQLGLDPYDVQITGGIAMHFRKLIEMQTVGN